MIALLSFLVLVVRVGRAAETRVVLVGANAADPTFSRVERELELLGIEVEILLTEGTTDLATIAREKKAQAAARVETSPLEILIWVEGDAQNGSPSLFRVSDTFTQTPEPALLALRAVELLRGRLLPVSVAPAPSESAVPTATPPASASAQIVFPTSSASAVPAPIASARGEVYVGPAVFGTPGGPAPAPALLVGGAYQLTSRFSLFAMGTIPLSPSTVSAKEGDVELHVTAFGGGGMVGFGGFVPELMFHAGAGFGVMGFVFEGHANPPWAPASGSHWSSLPFVDLAASYQITSVLALRTALLAAFALPPVSVVLAEREVATMGLPVLFGSVSLSVHP